jgi:hypothetical protein
MNMPTLVSDAPTRTTLFNSGTTTEEAVARRRNRWKWVLPFAAALVVAGGLIGLIALQFGPDLGISRSPATPAPVAANPAPAPEGQVPAGEAQVPAANEEKRPSPMEPPQVTPSSQAAANPPETSPAETTGQTPQKPAEGANAGAEAPKTTQQPSDEEQPEHPKLQPRPPKSPQDVLVTSEPAGATAMLDNNPALSCKTPCILAVAPGRHTLTLRQDGYQQESREIRIIDSPIEVPMVSLRAHAGTLMVTSEPAGAAIFLNDKPTPQKTPAQISLAPGTYSVRVEKDGLRKSNTIEIHNGETRYLKIPLQ